LEVNYIPHSATGSFSKLIEDYLAGKDSLKSFYGFYPDEKGLEEAIAARSGYPVQRGVLVNCIQKQYEGLSCSEAVAENIEALKSGHTFTVCTAHQPNLMTGYLYFMYKIIHAIKLARHLKEKHPAKHFVPVFYMGSEDNDLEELSVFRYEGKQYKWETKQTGAVGRMSTSDLFPLMEQLKSRLGPLNEHRERIMQVISEAYEGQATIADATRCLINALLGEYGIIVLDADDRELKRSFLPVMQEELLAPKAMDMVLQTSAALNEHYKAQAYARPINLFYLKEGLRERIEFAEGKWKALHTDITWNEEELRTELTQHPERFSPNVILRGLYQESILPDVAFIGGGSEVAYWMQLKPVFEYYNIFFPPLVLRQSALWMAQKETALQQRLGLSDESIFLPGPLLVREYTEEHAQHDLRLIKEQEAFTGIAREIRAKAKAIDPTLEASAAAAITKMEYQFARLEKKMLRAEKRNMADKVHHIEEFKKEVFPNHNLQERQDNFLAYYIQYGPAFFRELLNNTQPFGNRFLILKEQQAGEGLDG
jgi:bacillithiol biosynthesis cysteine-adding enzyme BshC